MTTRKSLGRVFRSDDVGVELSKFENPGTRVSHRSGWQLLCDFEDQAVCDSNNISALLSELFGDAGTWLRAIDTLGILKVRCHLCSGSTVFTKS